MNFPGSFEEKKLKTSIVYPCDNGLKASNKLIALSILGFMVSMNWTQISVVSAINSSIQLTMSNLRAFKYAIALAIAYYSFAFLVFSIFDIRQWKYARTGAKIFGKGLLKDSCTIVLSLFVYFVIPIGVSILAIISLIQSTM